MPFPDASGMMALKDTHRFTLSYKPDLVREAIRAFVWRRAVIEQKMMWVISALMLVFSAYLLGSGESLLFGVVVLVLAILPFVCVAVFWRMFLRKTLARYQEPREVTIDADGITIASTLGRHRKPWREIIEIWEGPHAFLLFSDLTVFDLLPHEGMPEAVRAGLKDHAARLAAEA